MKIHKFDRLQMQFNLCAVLPIMLLFLSIPIYQSMLSKPRKPQYVSQNTLHLIYAAVVAPLDMEVNNLSLCPYDRNEIMNPSFTWGYAQNGTVFVVFPSDNVTVKMKMIATRPYTA
jgi:hypothetical protein